MNKNQKRLTIFFAINVFQILPFISFRLAFKGDLFDTTLSQLGAHGFYYNLVIWGIFVGVFLVLSIFTIMNTLNMKNKRTKLYLILGSSFLILTVLVPCITDTLTTIHKVFTWFYIILSLIGCVFFVKGLSEVSRKIYEESLVVFCIFVVLSGSLFFIIGKSSFVEITVVMLLFLSLYIISMFIIGDRKRRENGDFPYDYKIKKTKECKIKYFANQPIYDNHIAASIKSNPEFKSIKEKNKQKIIFFYKDKFGYFTSSDNFDEIIPVDNNLIIKLDNILKETKEGTIEKIKENEEIKALNVNYDNSYDIFYFGRRDRLYRCETVLQFNN